MKRQKIKISVILTILTVMTNHSAYGGGGHELSVYGAGGLSSFRYQLPNCDVSQGMGGNFGLGYTYFVNQQWGAHIGAGLGMYNAKVTVNDITMISPDLIDNEGDRFDMHTILSGYRETQHAMYVNLPVMAVYQRPLFYVMGGVKTGIPINAKYTASSAKLENASYYPEYDNWATSQEFAGNGDFDDKKFKDKLKLGVSLMLALEAGTKIDVSKNISMYIGAFLDYGLNSVLKEKHHSFISYNAENPSDFNANLFSVSDKTNMMATGIILRMSFSFKSSLPKQYRNKGNPSRKKSVSPYINPFQEKQ